LVQTLKMNSLEHIPEVKDEINNASIEKSRVLIKRNTIAFSFLGNALSIRRNSPKTIQACLELGISLEEIQQKY